MKKKFFTLLSLTLVSVAFVNAQKNIPDSVKLKELIVTGSKVQQSPGNVTQKIDVIKLSQIENFISGNRNISELVSTLPGAAASTLSRNDANWGSYGGIGPKYSTYMLNGLPIDAFVDPQSLSLNAFKQIEVQRGPSSILYPGYLSQDFAGNQSPLAGTVNLVLKDNIEENTTKFSLGYGSYNTLNGQVFSQSKYGKLSLFTGADYEKSDYYNYGTKGSWLNMIDNPQYQKAKIFTGIIVSPFKNDKHKISVFANHTSHIGDAGRPNRGYNHDYNMLNFSYLYNFNKKITGQFKIGLRHYGRSWQEDNYSNNADQSLNSNNGVTQDIVPADLSVTYKHGKANLLTAGVDYQSAFYLTYTDPINASHTVGNNAKAMQVAPYLQEEMTFGKLIARAGIRYNTIKNDITMLGGQKPGNESQSWTKLIYSAGLKYNATKLIALFTNAGTSFMTPGLKSIGGTIPLTDLGVAGQNGQLPNPNLNPESGLGADFGVDFNNNNRVKASMRLFANIINDAIIENVVSQNPSQSQSINAGKTQATGFEISTFAKIKEFVDVFANYTYTLTTISNPNDADQDGAQVPFVPMHLINFGFTLNLPADFHVSSYLHYNSSIYDGTSKSGRTSFDGHELVNAKIWKSLYTKENKSIDLFIDLYNITNNKFEMPWQFQDPGFSAGGGIRFNL